MASSAPRPARRSGPPTRPLPGASRSSTGPPAPRSAPTGDLTGDPARLARYALRATPMEEVPELRFASRPASRAGGLTLESLRAIPWVFSWNQSRHGIPGWFGLGSALDALFAEVGEERARALYREWPFLRGVVDDARIALTQADLEVAGHYAGLAEPGDRVVMELIARSTGGPWPPSAGSPPRGACWAPGRRWSGPRRAGTPTSTCSPTSRWSCSGGCGRRPSRSASGSARPFASP